MKLQSGLLLRMLGLLLELACASILMRTRGEGRVVLGVPLESLLMGGFVVGLLMVVSGLTLFRKKPSGGAKPSDLDLDLDRDRS